MLGANRGRQKHDSSRHTMRWSINQACVLREAVEAPPWHNLQPKGSRKRLLFFIDTYNSYDVSERFLDLSF